MKRLFSLSLLVLLVVLSAGQALAAPAFSVTSTLGVTNLPLMLDGDLSTYGTLKGGASGRINFTFDNTADTEFKIVAGNVNDAGVWAYFVWNHGGQLYGGGSPCYQSKWHYEKAKKTVTVKPPCAEIDGGYLALDADILNVYEISLSVAVDETPPAAPSGFSAMGYDGRVELSWSANVENDLAGYIMYRDGERINPELLTVAQYADENVVNGVVYKYWVTAVDDAGNESGISPIVEVTPKEAPSYIPENFFVALGESVVSLEWDAVEGAESYNVYRDGEKIATVENPGYTDEQIEVGSTHVYKISAVVEGSEYFAAEKSVTVRSVIHFGKRSFLGIGALVGTAWNFVRSYSTIALLVLALPLAAIIINFVAKLFGYVPKYQRVKNTGGTQRLPRVLSDDENMRRKRERKLWKARIDKYELLTRSGRIAERDQWIKDAKIEKINERIERRNKRLGRVEGQESVVRDSRQGVKGRKQRAGRAMRSERGGRSGRGGNA